MGTTVMKEAPGVDYYLVWSSIVEAPLCAGTREEMLGYLWDLDDRKPERINEFDQSHPENRLKRADECGTSALWKVAGHPVEGSWEDAGGMVYEQRGSIARANLFVLTRRLGEDETADATDLIEPFEDRETAS